MRRYERPNRRSARSRQHDYDRPGMYFVTICASERESILGQVTEGVMALNQSGRIVEACWRELPQRFRPVRLDTLVIMPNHVHGVIELSDDGPESTPALHTVVGAFKTDTARRINAMRGTRGMPVWQRSFHDQIIRDDQHLQNVRAYIDSNPANWHADEDNPANHK